MVDLTQTVSMRIWPGPPLDLTISGEGNLLSYWDCLSRYHHEAPIDSLEKVHEVRARMNSEGPRLWREPGNEGIVWMPLEFWGFNYD